MIKIEHGPTKIECDDVAQAAALVNLLVGGTLTPATSSAEPKEKRARKAKRASAAGSAPSEGRGAVKAKILAYVAKNPLVDLGKIAVAVYGVDEPRRRASAGTTLRMCVNRGELKRLANGEYRLV